MKTSSPKKFEDSRVNIKTRLSLFWVALMFLYIYNDILSFFQPGHVAELVEGSLGGLTFTQPFLISAAVLMALPSLVIILSLLLKARAGRMVNIIFGFFHILVLVSTQFVGETETWIFWRINEALEFLIMILIIWTAWKWPQEGDA